MNSNLKILSEGEFPLTMNQHPQTSTFLSPIAHSTFPISPGLQLSYPKQKAPVLSAFSANDDKFPIAERCLNFDLNSNDFSRNKLDLTPCKTSFIGFQTSNQTPNYVSQKHKSENAMELEIPAFTVEESQADKLIVENEDQSFKNLLQKIDLSHKNVSSSETKPSSREKYPQPKKKNPSLLKQFKEKERVFPPKNSKGAQKFSGKDHMNMPMPLTHFTRSNSDVPPTLESHLGSFGAKEGSLGDNKYLNNLKDNKGTDKKPTKVEEEKSKFEFPSTSRFDVFQTNNDNASKGNDQKLRFAKNLFADFNEESGNGLFQIPERNFESEFPIDLKSPQKNDMDGNIEFEIENNNNDSLVGLLNFKNENSHDFEIEENRNLDFMFHGEERNLSPRREHYQTPKKDLLTFDNTQSLSQNRFFSTATAKKEPARSMLFSDHMNSTNVTDRTEQNTGDFFSLRKGELTSSSRKENKVKSFGTSRFENDYEVLEVLGSGDFGTVYKCRHKLDGLNYAVKCTNSKFKEDGNNHQMLNDLATLSALDENPFIVRYYSAWIEEEKLYIVMEYCQNNLRRFRSEFSKLSESTIRKIMRDVCSGLKFLHSQNIVHLALKPENILYSMTRKYKIADLGLSRIAQNSQNHDLIEGDYRYTAPELLNDFETTELSKADIYSLGVIIYELMTGSELLRNGQEWLDIRNGNLHKLDHLTFSNSLKSIIRSMTSGNPNQRPSAEELMASFLQSETELELRWEKKENRTLKRQIQELESQLKIHRKNSF